jgi:hypothetical protein
LSCEKPKFTSGEVPYPELTLIIKFTLGGVFSGPLSLLSDC